jgi:hypothetical protein
LTAQSHLCNTYSCTVSAAHPVRAGQWTLDSKTSSPSPDPEPSDARRAHARSPPVMAGGAQRARRWRLRIIERDQCPTPSQRAARASVKHAHHQTCITAPSWRGIKPGGVPPANPHCGRTDAEPALRTAIANLLAAWAPAAVPAAAYKGGEQRGRRLSPVLSSSRITRAECWARALLLVGRRCTVAVSSCDAAGQQQAQRRSHAAHAAGIVPATKDEDKLWGASQTTATSAIG